MPAIRKWRLTTRTLRLLTAMLLMTVLAVLLLAGSALAATMPGKPSAKTPTGTVTTTTPTFTWGKAARATAYELRVYEGSVQVLKKTGLKKLSYQAVKALPASVALTWKVRASAGRIAGAWSSSLAFTIAAAGPVIGQRYGGGVVAYILQSGDPGYVAGQTHGLIAAVADQTPFEGGGIQWAAEPYWSISVPGTGTDIGTGSANTDAIIAQNGAGSAFAAGLARAYSSGGYSDWYLPSKDELNKLFLNQAAIGGFVTATMATPYYWSSSEFHGTVNCAWIQYMNGGSQTDGYKGGLSRVRAVRAF